MRTRWDGKGLRNLGTLQGSIAYKTVKYLSPAHVNKVLLSPFTALRATVSPLKPFQSAMAAGSSPGPVSWGYASFFWATSTHYQAGQQQL